MLVLTLLLSFTGYLLPWDQLAIWAITVGSNMARATPFLGHEGPGAQLLRLGDVPLIHAADDARFALLGGTFVGEGALLRFYVLHCVGLPLGIAVLMAVHFWRVRKDGGISGRSRLTGMDQARESMPNWSRRSNESMGFIKGSSTPSPIRGCSSCWRSPRSS